MRLNYLRDLKLISGLSLNATERSMLFLGIAVLFCACMPLVMPIPISVACTSTHFYIPLGNFGDLFFFFLLCVPVTNLSKIVSSTIPSCIANSSTDDSGAGLYGCKKKKKKKQEQFVSGIKLRYLVLLLSYIHGNGPEFRPI